MTPLFKIYLSFALIQPQERGTFAVWLLVF